MKAIISLAFQFYIFSCPSQDSILLLCGSDTLKVHQRSDNLMFRFAPKVSCEMPCGFPVLPKSTSIIRNTINSSTRVDCIFFKQSSIGIRVPKGWLENVPLLTLSEHSHHSRWWAQGKSQFLCIVQTKLSRSQCINAPSCCHVNN